jgi:hypothetical protein
MVFFVYLLCGECFDKGIVIVLSHVIYLELIFEFILGVNGDRSLFSQQVVLRILVDFDAVLGLGFLPVGKRRDGLGLFIAHEKIRVMSKDFLKLNFILNDES